MSTAPIVVGTDGESRANVAVDKAGELGRALGVEVHVVCAPAHLGGQDWPPRIDAQRVVADAHERLRGQGTNVHTHIPVGDAAAALGAVAEDVRAQMIVLGNRGMTGLGRFLRSLPNSVSHEARCDVLIVPTQAQELAEFSGRPIVVGVDGASSSTPVLAKAISMAKALGGHLHIVSVSTPAGDAVAAALDRAAEQGVDATIHTRDEGPTDAIRGVAADNDGAIIVIAGKGMHVDDREHFGNVADKLSHDGRFSVLVVFTAGDGAGAATEAPAAAVSTGEPASP